MSGVSDLVGHHGAADACMFGPADHARFEEGPVDDQLSATVKQVEQACLALGPVELVLLLHGHPRHPPTLGGQRVTGASQLLLLYEQLLARSLPFLRRHDWRCVRCEMPFAVLLGSLLVLVHVCLLVAVLLVFSLCISCFGL